LLRRIAIRTACRAAFASALADDEIARAETVLRWFDRVPRVTSPALRRRSRFTLHGLQASYISTQLAAIGASLIDHADVRVPSETTAVVEHLAHLPPPRQQQLVGELLLGAAGPLTQVSGWMLLRFATEGDAASRVRAGWDPREVEAFVREVTRLHPTNVRITRSALVDTEVGGEPVPAHTRVLLNVSGLNRDPRFWDEPERFLPERWLDGRPWRDKFAYLSFGVGDRRCLGEAMGVTALAALLPELARNWQFGFGELRASSAGRHQLAEETRVTVSGC
jgi:cytochrome P450